LQMVPQACFARMEPIDVSVQELNERMYQLKQQHDLLMLLHPSSLVVADAAQALDRLQSSMAVVAADVKTLLQKKQKQAETQQSQYSSMLPDLSELQLPASVLQGLSDEWLDSVQSLAAYLKQHDMQHVFRPILQCCTNGSQLMDMTAAVDGFMRHTAPQCSVGPAGAVYDDAMLLFNELQQLIEYGRAGTYLQLCKVLLAADTPASLYIRLHHARAQLQVIRDEAAVHNMYAAAAAAAAAAPASTGSCSAAVVVEVVVEESSSSSSSSSTPTCQNSTAAATTAADNTAAALPEDPFDMCCSAEDCSDTSAELPVVHEAFRQLSDDDGPSTPAVMSVPASCAPSARPSCDESGDASSNTSSMPTRQNSIAAATTAAATSSSSDGDAQPAAGSKQQQRVARKGWLLRGVAGCAVLPFRLLLRGVAETALLYKPCFG
jgi:hypothetical protein